MKKQLVIIGIVLTLVMTALVIVPAPTAHAPGFNWETVWQIGDAEASPMDDPCDGPYYYTPYIDPFVIGTNTDNDFPWVTTPPTAQYPYANNYNITWNGALPYGGRLVLSWAPGASSIDNIDIYLDGTHIYTLNEVGYYNYSWFMGWVRREYTITLGPLAEGNHVLFLDHTFGDGAAWDWLRLEKPSNQPPVADAGPDQTLEQTSHAGAVVTLDGSGSYDPDGDSLTYDWTWDGGSTTGVSPAVTLPLGTTTVTLTVSDGTYTDSDTVDIKVQDTTPPDITLSGDQIVLWPPNHKYVTIQISDFVISVTDICDANVDINDVKITSVSSDEPENAKGDGDGNTWNDIVILNAQTVNLRAEREGTGNGRVYTINFGVTDLSGNTATGCCKIWVPHDQGAHSTAIDDGASVGYTVYYP